MATDSIKMLVLCFMQLALFVQVCFGSIENIDLNYTQPAAAFDELYSDAIEYYTNESWGEAIRYFQLALADHRHESEVRANCLIKCREKTDRSDILRNGQYDGGSLMLYYAIRVRRCCDLCEETFLGRRSPVAQFIRDAFEKREPYNYLQFCYFKINQYQNAANAAHTYLERNPGDIVMLSNIKMYMDKYNASQTAIKSLESVPHFELFLQGDREYLSENFLECTHSFELSLEEYYKAYSKCQALCEYQHRKHQASFSVALFSHQTAIIKCRLSCAESLATFNGSRKEKFLEDHYHYLQFCYFEVGRIKEAATCAKTYLLFQPNDPIMAANMEFYSKNIRTTVADIPTRERAEKYIRQRKLDEKLFKVSKYYANPDLMFTDAVPQLDDLEEASTTVTTPNVHQKSSRKMADGPKFEKSDLESTHKKLFKTKRRNKWENNPLFKGVKLFKEGKQLNGTDRFVVDNMSSSEDCSNLILLLQKLSKFGDGYKHNHADPKHPFTDKETFEGVSIGDAVMAAVNGEITAEEAKLYSDLSEKMRLFVADYFNLKEPLYTAFTHLVCRTASEEANDEVEHLSHPVHSDNCILNADGPGTCPKVHPAYTWRDYSGILYLNDDFEGGDFIFTDHGMKTQASVRPKCGRMVAFTGGAENLHGVLGVKSGRRCALPLWFTFQKDKIEDNREKYIEILKNLRKNEINQSNDNDNTVGKQGAKASKLSDSVDIKKNDLGSQIRTDL